MFEGFGVSRARSTVHNWVQEDALDPWGGCSSENVALDEPIVKIDGEQFWVVGAVAPRHRRDVSHGRFKYTKPVCQV